MVVDSPLQDCSDRRELGIANSLRPQPCFNQRGFPRDQILRSQPRRIIVFQERRELTKDAPPLIDCLVDRPRLRGPAIHPRRSLRRTARD